MDDAGSGPDLGGFDASGERSKNVYETIFRAIDDAVFLIDVERASGGCEFTFRRNNASHRQQTGLSEDELRGQTPRELLGATQGAEVVEHYRRCVERAEPIEYEETLELPAGTTHWETKLTPITEDGEVTQIVGTARNISERKERERELRRVHRRFETVLETMSTAVFLKDTDGRYLLMNQACRELFGIGENEDIAGLTDEDLLPPDRADGARTDDQRVIENEERIEVEETVPTTQGETVRLTRKSPVYDEDGTVEAICGVSTDITAQKERERELEYYERIINTFGDIATVIDPDGTITYVSPSVRRVLGYAPDDLLGENGYEYQPPETAEAVEAAIRHVIEHPDESRTVQTKFRRVDGSWCWIESTIQNRLDDDVIDGLLVNSRDITERKDSEKAIEQAHEELRQIIDLVPDLIFSKNRDGEYLLANEATAEAYGLTPEALEGREEREVMPEIEDAEQFREDDIEVIESGEPKKIPEEELTTAEGETKVLQTTKIPYRIPESGEDAVLGYARDVTELKEYEQTLEHQRDTLKVLNQVVRHDIRNDLQLVLAYAEMLEAHVEGGGEEYIREVLSAARDAVEITQTARDVTEVLLQSQTERSPIRLRYSLEGSVDGMRSSHEHAVITVGGSIPDIEVLADDMLGSVFRNLLNNAIIHNDKEIPEVAVSAAADDEIVQIRVADNGPGIPDDQKERIFEEGEKGLGSGGTGLGLYLVQTLIDRYGGDIWVADNEPEGSVFTVELPRCE